MIRDPLYIAFLYHFNVTEDYFECHEVMETLWLEEGRSLLCQGLLQVAVGLYHHRNGNVNGAIKLFQGAVNKLEQYPDAEAGIDLGDLVRRSREYLQGLERGRDQYPFRPFRIRITDPELERLVARLKERPPEPHH